MDSMKQKSCPGLEPESQGGLLRSEIQMPKLAWTCVQPVAFPVCPTLFGLHST